MRRRRQRRQMVASFSEVDLVRGRSDDTLETDWNGPALGTPWLPPNSSSVGGVQCFARHVVIVGCGRCSVAGNDPEVELLDVVISISVIFVP